MRETGDKNESGRKNMKIGKGKL